MLGWQSFVRERERRLASEGGPVKFARAASVGLECLDPGRSAEDLPQLLACVSTALRDADSYFIAAIDERVRAAALLLMADDFADVVWTGSATRHVRLSLERRFSRDEVRSAWSIISPASYAARLSARLDRLLIVSGELDTVFLPELTRNYVERLRSLGLCPTWIRYECGHYTLALPFYAAGCFVRTLAHLRACL